MSKSIMQKEKECYVTRSRGNLQKHHIYFGANRKVSEKHGFWVWLIGELHNQSNLGVHCGNSELDLRLKRECQAKFEETHSREEFVALIGRNYLD